MITNFFVSVEQTVSVEHFVTEQKQKNEACFLQAKKNLSKCLK